MRGICTISNDQEAILFDYFPVSGNPFWLSTRLTDIGEAQLEIFGLMFEYTPS